MRQFTLLICMQKCRRTRGPLSFLHAHTQCSVVLIFLVPLVNLPTPRRGVFNTPLQYVHCMPFVYGYLAVVALRVGTRSDISSVTFAGNKLILIGSFLVESQRTYGDRGSPITNRLSAALPRLPLYPERPCGTRSAGYQPILFCSTLSSSCGSWSTGFSPEILAIPLTPLS